LLLLFCFERSLGQGTGGQRADLKIDEWLMNEGVPTKTDSGQGGARGTEGGGVALGLYGGAALPQGDFAERTGTEAGLAKLGYSAGGRLDVQLGSPEYSWSFVGQYTSNQTDVEEFYLTETGKPVTLVAGSWSTVWILTGPTVEGVVNKRKLFYLGLSAGILIGHSPEVRIIATGLSGGQKGSTAYAFAFSADGGFYLNPRVRLGVRYTSGRPEYEMLATTPGGSMAVKMRQRTEVLTVYLSMALVWASE